MKICKDCPYYMESPFARRTCIWQSIEIVTKKCRHKEICQRAVHEVFESFRKKESCIK